MHNTAWGDDMAKKPTKKEMIRLIDEMVKLSNAEEWEALKTKADDFIEKFRNEAVGYFYRGLAKDELGHHEEAIKDYDKAIELNPNNANVYSNRGNAKNRLGRYEEALKDLNNAIELNPHLFQAYNNRGATKGKIGHYEEAIQDFDKAIDLKPDYVNAYNNRGNAKDELGRHEEAIKDYDKAIDLKPDHADAYNNRGSAKYKLGHHEEAIKDYDKAIELKHDYADAYNGRGIAKSNLGHYTEAIKDYDKAIELDDLKPSYYHNRALAIGKKAAKESEKKLISGYQKQLKQFTDPKEIVELYEDEINRSSLRTYGTKSFTTQEEDKEKKAERLEKADKPIKKSAWRIWHGLGHFLHWFGHRVLPNCLEKKASYSSFLLRVFVIVIFAFLLVLYLANNLFDFISVLLKFSLSGFTNLQLFKGHISDITLGKALSFLSFQAILSAPFYLYARRANREFQEERVRLHTLMRDRNLILLWSAQEQENKALFSGKLFDQMTQSSTADLSLRMMNPRQAARFQEAQRPLTKGDDPYDKGSRDRESQDKREANLLEKITDTIKSAISTNTPS